MKQSEIFYFDVDGTLLDNKTGRVPQSALNALNALKQQGYKVALCTGRSAAGIQEVKVDNLIDWDGYVLSNGCLILDKDKNVIQESSFSQEWLHELTSYHKGAMLFEGDETFITGEINQRLLEAIEHYNAPEMYPHRPYNNEKVYNIMSYDFDSLDQQFQDKLRAETQLVFDMLGNCEIMTREGGKHNGVDILNKHLGVKTYTGFGDSANDVGFLKKAHFAVAMGNGNEAVKKVSHYTTTSVMNDGIALALKQYGVLEDIR